MMGKEKGIPVSLEDLKRGDLILLGLCESPYGAFFLEKVKKNTFRGIFWEVGKTKKDRIVLFEQEIFMQKIEGDKDPVHLHPAPACPPPHPDCDHEHEAIACIEIPQFRMCYCFYMD